MKIALVTGAGGLVGSAAVCRLVQDHDLVIGIDNNMRGQLFGSSGSVSNNIEQVKSDLGEKYRHETADIRDLTSVEGVLSTYGSDIAVVVHAAAQPSHDWAAQDPSTDFSINAVGSFNLLESLRKHAPHAVFLYMSTSKVYGEHPHEGETGA